MAIFYQGVKALNGEYYSYLMWQNSSDINKVSKNNPQYFLGNRNSFLLKDVSASNQIDMGYLLTSHVDNQLYGRDDHNSTDYLSFWIRNVENPIARVYRDDTTIKLAGNFLYDNNVNINNCIITTLQVTQGIMAFPKTNNMYSLRVTQDGIHVDGTITVDGTIEATSFNATSDKRAKKNITKANFSALDIITKTPIYSFTYKNNNVDSIGIIAQEVQDVQIDKFSIVNNKEASGENGDYMSIVEDKLIYVLWKAIQEQQEEISKLKKQLEEK